MCSFHLSSYFLFICLVMFTIVSSIELCMCDVIGSFVKCVFFTFWCLILSFNHHLFFLFSFFFIFPTKSRSKNDNCFLRQWSLSFCLFVEKCQLNVLFYLFLFTKWFRKKRWNLVRDRTQWLKWWSERMWIGNFLLPAYRDDIL